MISRRKFLSTSAWTAVGALASQSAFAQFAGMPSMNQAISQSIISSITDAIDSTVQLVLSARAQIDLSQVTPVRDIATGKGKGLREKKHLLQAHGDGSVSIWDLDQGRQVKKVEKLHAAPVQAIAMSQEQGLAVSAAEDGSVAVISSNSGLKKADWKSKEGTKATSVDVANKANVAAVGLEDGSVAVLDVDKGAEIAQVKASKNEIKSVVVSNDALTIVAADVTGTLTLVDPKKGKAVKSVKAHTDEITSTTVLADGSGIVTTSKDGSVKKWSNDLKKVEAEIKTSAPVKAAALSDDGSRVATTDESGAVKVHDITSKQVVAEIQAPAEVQAVEFGTSKDVVHVVSEDGTSSVLDTVKAKETARVVTTDDGWAAVDLESGNYEAVGNVIDAIKWEAEDMAFDLDQFGESHNEPGVLAMASAGEEVKPAVQKEKPKLSVSFATPPHIEIATPDDNVETDDDEYEVSIQAADLGGGVKEIRLYQNDKLVAKHLPDEDEAEDQVYSKDFEIKLATGKNKLRAVALSNDFIESKPSKVEIAFSGAKRKSVLHVTTIGINEYRNPALSLNYGVPDAKGIKNFFEGQPKALFKDIKTTAVFDRDANRSGIKDAIMSLKDSQPEDVVMLYLAGHGDTIGETWYFMPYDVTYPEREDHVREKGISSEELEGWMNEIPAQKVVMLMDACKSGAAVVKTRGFEERKALSRLSRTSGTHIIAGAAKDQFAVEFADLGHGAFTYSLLEALRGGGVNPRKNDGLVSIRGLSRYIEDRLPELSEEGGREPQFPVVNSRGQDFPLAVKV